MAYTYSPRNGSPALPLDEVIRRLQATFPVATIDAERASQDLRQLLAFMERAQANGATAYTPERLLATKLKIGRSWHVTLADSTAPAEAYLAFTIDQDEPRIFVGFESEGHEQATEELRARLADALDYEEQLV